MKNNLLASAFLLILLTTFPGCITGGSSADDSVITTADLDSRENSRKLDQLSKSLSSLTETLDNFQTDIRYLREEIDALKDRVSAIDGGVRKNTEKSSLYEEGDIVTSPPPPLETIKEESLPQDEEIRVTSLNPEDYYQNAYDDLRFREYESAIENFEKFVQRYPNDGLADNAQYWIGECYYGLKNFQKAAEEFKKVYEKYPQGNKVPDAKLKYALCLFDLKEVDRCFAELEKLSAEYKGTRIGELAVKQIERLKKKIKD